jgi:nitrite reductase (NADH) small subunit
METTIQSLETEVITEWVTVCDLEQILPNTGVCALVGDQQVAIFRVGAGTELYAISNYDPFSKAHVLSRGLVGDRKGTLKIASPIYKQNFCLKTGECLDDPAVQIPTYLVRVSGTEVQICNTI